jgi:hypothetical protein
MVDGKYQRSGCDSIEFKQTNYTGLYVALGVIAVGGLLFLGWAIGMNKATSH